MEDQHVIIVTGAATGIGAAIVDTLLASSTSRLMLVDINEELLKARQLAVGSERLQYLVGDVSEAETNEVALKKTIEKWGRLDALALNAGVMAPVHRLEGSSAADWTRGFNINLISQVAMLSVAIPHLRQAKGRVIMTTSGAGTQPTWPGWGAYGATKAAINYLIKVLALEEPEIVVVGIRPGVVDTPLLRGIFRGDFKAGMSDEELEAYKDMVTPQLVQPKQPGSVIGNLALRADKGLRGEIMFWDDEKLTQYR